MTTTNGQVLVFTLSFEHACDCINCGIPVIMPQSRMQELLRSHELFYCVNGHRQHWVAKSDVEKMREQLAEKDRQLAFERERASTNFAAREKAEKESRRLKKRIAGGACPCCKRSFQNLTRHMATKHPDFTKDAR